MHKYRRARHWCERPRYQSEYRRTRHCVNTGEPDSGVNTGDPDIGVNMRIISQGRLYGNMNTGELAMNVKIMGNWP